METIDRIKVLCKQKNITIQQLEKELGEKPSSISKTSSNSKAEKLYKIAQYFGVSMEFLIAGIEPAAGVFLSREEVDIISAYRKLSEPEKNIVAKSLDVKRQDTGLELSSKIG